MGIQRKLRQTYEQTNRTNSATTSLPRCSFNFRHANVFRADSEGWKKLKPDVPPGTDSADEQKLIAAAKAAKEELKTFLLSSLQMQHVVVLAGSGTSLGPITKGPSMWALSDTVCIPILVT